MTGRRPQSGEAWDDVGRRGRWAGGPFSPAFAAFLLAAVGLCGWAASVAVPFYRREVTAEGQARVAPLDGLRGLLCFCVMCSHAAVTWSYVDTGEWLEPPSRVFGLFGQASVALFFCVTAFLFWGRAVARDGDVAAGPFFRGRAFRLVPLYLVSCGLAVVAIGLGGHPGWTSRPMLTWVGRMALMGLRPWGTDGPIVFTAVNAGVVWTLQNEWAFYALLPALAVIGGAGKGKRLWFLWAGTFVLLGPGPVMSFARGMGAVYAARNPAVANRLRARWVSAGMVTAVVIWPALTGSAYGLRGLALTTVIFVPVACGNRVFGLLTLRGLRACGVVSYSVYLLHGIVLYAAEPWLARLKHGGGGAAGPYWAGVVGLAVGVLALSLLTYRWVEWPAIAFERRWRQREGVRPTSELVRQVVASPQ